MKKYLALLLFSFAFVLVACDEDNYYEENDYYEENTVSSAAPTSGESGWLNDFSVYLAETFEEDNIPGMAVSIVQGDEIVFAQGYGLRNVQKNLPVTPETLFHIGSTHKSINAMLVAALIDEGYFEWDTPAIEIYPDFTLSDADYETEVTLRHLLSMTSGIPDYAEDDLSESARAEEIFSVLAQSDLLDEPGGEFSYSNLSATIAGYLSVIATNGDTNNLFDAYADLLQTYILDPIGMNTSTIYASEAAANANVSLSYAVYSDGETELTPSYDRDGDALAPSGSLKSNVLEMALYISTQLNGGKAPNGTQIVSKSTLSETWEPYLEDYGMGWEVRTYSNVDVILHTGAYDGFVSVIGFVPEYEVGFVILMNSEDVGDNLLENAPSVLVGLLED